MAYRDFFIKNVVEATNSALKTETETEIKVGGIELKILSTTNN